MAAASAIRFVSDEPSPHGLKTIRGITAAHGSLRVVQADKATVDDTDCRAALAIIDATTLCPAMPLVARLGHTTDPYVPIIVTIAAPTWRRARHFSLAGATDYVPQSLDPAPLARSLRRVLEGMSREELQATVCR